MAKQKKTDKQKSGLRAFQGTEALAKPLGVKLDAVRRVRRRPRKATA